jgi:hypothetical protein
MKYILTESQIKKIIDTKINEQSEEAKFTVRVQKFLNHIFSKEKGFKPLVVDGKTGPNSQTEAAIEKLQTILQMYPVDGVWGPDTEEALKTKKPELYKIWKDNYKPGYFSDMF